MNHTNWSINDHYDEIDYITFSSLNHTGGDRENIMSATILTIEMQFIEPVITCNNLLGNDGYDEIH